MDTLSVMIGIAVGGLGDVVALGMMIGGAALIMVGLGIAGWLWVSGHDG